MVPFSLFHDGEGDEPDIAIVWMRHLTTEMPRIYREGCMKYILAIDQGTTQTTEIVGDEHTLFIGGSSVPLLAHFPRPGWVKRNPFDIVRTVVAPLIKKYEIAAVGFDNQGETFVMWDGETSQFHYSNFEHLQPSTCGKDRCYRCAIWQNPDHRL